MRAGSDRAAQRSEDMASDAEEARKFYLQYFFPPSSVGEVGRLGTPGRREIGHGALAERALAPIIPDEARAPPCLPTWTCLLKEYFSPLHA